MKSSLFLILFLAGSSLMAQTQPAAQAPQLPPGAMQQPPADTQQPPAQQEPTQQVPPQQNAPGAPPQAAGGPPPAQSNVAATLQVFAYPKANQPPEKQAQDENECFQWAQGQGAAAAPQQGAQQGQQ